MKLLFILLLGLGFSQTEVETRVYQVDINIEGPLDLLDLTGYDLENAIFHLYSLSDYELQGNVEYWYNCDSHWGNSEFFAVTENGLGNATKTHTYVKDDNCSFIRTSGNPPLSGNVQIAITAEFPEEDTGYIEEGFEFCVQPGANLLSFPCDSSIEVSECLPSGIENFIESIIGQGVATEYSPTLGWIGSLDEFDPGSGYWFTSNSSLCFEYDCVED